jgi:NADH dehydrogenase
VIVGSGFTGFECARRLARRLRKLSVSDVTVTIISPVDYMLYTPLLPDVAGGVLDPRFVTIALAGTLGGVDKVRGRVESVDLNQHALTFTDLDQRSHRLSWDRLVLTPGSVSRLFDIPGLASHAKGLKSTAEALFLRDHVLEQLELAWLEHDPDVAAAVAPSWWWGPLTPEPSWSSNCARWPTQRPSKRTSTRPTSGFCCWIWPSR